MIGICAALNLPAPTLLRDLRSGMKLPEYPVMLALVRHGVNVSWMLTGEGSVFADTRAGEILKANFDVKLTEYLNAEEPPSKLPRKPLKF